MQLLLRQDKKAATRLLTRILEKARQAVAQENVNYDARGQFVQKSSQPFSTPSKLNETY